MARPEPAMPHGLVILLGALTAFGPMAIDMYLPSLPSIVRDLGGPTGGAQLTVAAFLAGLAFGQLVYGPLSDRIGRRGPLLAGICLFDKRNSVRKLSNHLKRIVCRSVIDNDHFHLRPSNSQRTPDRRVYKLCVIVVRDDDGKSQFTRVAGHFDPD